MLFNFEKCRISKNKWMYPVCPIFLGAPKEKHFFFFRHENRTHFIFDLPIISSQLPIKERVPKNVSTPIQKISSACYTQKWAPITQNIFVRIEVAPFVYNYEHYLNDMYKGYKHGVRKVNVKMV